MILHRSVDEKRKMSIVLSRVRKINEEPDPYGRDFQIINAVSWFPNNTLHVGEQKVPLYELSPYYLRNEEGQLMENLWQGVKIYKSVFEQKQVYSGHVTWQWKSEIHIKDGEILPEYWKWRHALINNQYPVRYPNGYGGKHLCQGSLRYLPEEERPATGEAYEHLNYIEARKKIYCPVYRSLVQKTTAYQCLQVFLANGVNLQITDVDVPDAVKVDQASFDQYLNDPSRSFGHTWTLAASLLGLKMEY